MCCAHSEGVSQCRYPFKKWLPAAVQTGALRIFSSPRKIKIKSTLPGLRMFHAGSQKSPHHSHRTIKFQFSFQGLGAVKCERRVSSTLLGVQTDQVECVYVSECCCGLCIWDMESVNVL